MGQVIMICGNNIRYNVVIFIALLLILLLSSLLVYCLLLCIVNHILGVKSFIHNAVHNKYLSTQSFNHKNSPSSKINKQMLQLHSTLAHYETMRAIGDTDSNIGILLDSKQYHTTYHEQ